MMKNVAAALMLGAATMSTLALAKSDPVCSVAVADRDAKRYAADLARTDLPSTAMLDALIGCLADPDPAARDDFALTAFSAALRSEKFPEALVRRAHVLLPSILSQADDSAGVRKPFAAIALAEVARYDRLTPFLTAKGRSALATVASAYLRSITDLRGFTPGEGWRHGVAHGADLLMQLSLNPALVPEDATVMLDGIAAQVAPAGTHSFIHGESQRLARPVIFMAANAKVTDAQLAAFFAKLKPDGGPRWAAAYASTEGLAALHNSRAFAVNILVESLRSKDPNIQRLAPLAMDMLRAMP